MPTTGHPNNFSNADAPLLIAGASARQHVESAARAAIQCVAADLFDDWDTNQVCPSLKIGCFEDLADAARSLNARSWLMCGGLENYPQTIARLNQNLRFFGPTPTSIARVKDPIDLARFCRKHSVAFPEVRTTAPVPATVWLKKPFSSAGGHHIEFATQARYGQSMDEAEFFFQRHVPGTPISAIFVTGKMNQTQLIGISRQLVGDSAFVKQRFAYCGSIGPLVCSSSIQQQVTRMGELVALEYEMKGVFGLDLIANSRQICLIEVNPRLTASCEIIEMSGACESVTQVHILACTGEPLNDRFNALPANGPVGKAIVFSNARRAFEIDQNVHQQLVALNNANAGRLVADIPRSGTTILPGHPVISIYEYSQGPGTNHHQVHQVHQKLAHLAHRIRQMIAASLPAAQFD